MYLPVGDAPMRVIPGNCRHPGFDRRQRVCSSRLFSHDPAG